MNRASAQSSSTLSTKSSRPRPTINGRGVFLLLVKETFISLPFGTSTNAIFMGAVVARAGDLNIGRDCVARLPQRYERPLRESRRSPSHHPPQPRLSLIASGTGLARIEAARVHGSAASASA